MMRASILHNEIVEQPEAISRLINGEKENIDRIAYSIKSQFSYIYIAARGSSDNAARYAQYLFGIQNHIAVGLATPSIFSLYKQPPRLENALVIGISQSGQSPDVISVLEAASDQGCPTIAITNDSGSPLAARAKYIIDLHAGPEQAIAATKTYTSSLVALAMLSTFLNGNQGGFAHIEKVPSWVESTINNTISQITRVERFRYMQQCSVLGRGYNYSTSFETSLKIKEINRIVAEPYSTADFRHGPISTIYPGFPVFVIASPGATFGDSAALVSDLDALGAEMILVSSENISRNNPGLHFKIPDNVPEWLSPIPNIIPGQLFAMQLAIERGMDPDFPDGLDKVTQTL